jgi:tripartite-type tricarboxylate transporter receptor subunit TctC
MFAPARTPDRILKKLSGDVVRIVAEPDIKEKFFNTGVEPMASTPEQFAAIVKGEIARLGKVVKEAGIKAE